MCTWYHTGLILETIGFFLVAIIVTVVFGDKTGLIRPWLEDRKRSIHSRAEKKPNCWFWRFLSKPDMVTYLIVVFGTGFAAIGKVILTVVNW